MRSPDPLVSENQPSPDGEDISPFYDWKSSVMANAFTDPYFRAVMMHETEVFPHLAGFIEDTCLTCHSPMARTHAHQTGVSLVQDESCLLEDGCYRADQALEDPHAREGISCTACHQITNSVLSGDVNSGNFEIVDADHPDAFTIYGPYQNPVGQAMQNQVGYTPAFGMQMADSRHCASCHELFTPTLDMVTDEPNGEVFPEQTPYTEWENSDLGPSGADVSCQQCHMAREEISDSYQTRIAVMANGGVNLNWPERSPYFPHVMVGGNTWLLETLELFREELGRAEINEEGEFTTTAELTRDLLKTSADLLVANQDFSGGALTFDLTIINKAGHKLPTSFPSRRIWVATRVTDSKGVVIFDSGFPDENYQLSVDAAFTSDRCMAIKKPADFESSACFQEHINLVTAPEDIPIYEVVMGSSTGAITHVLLYAADRLKDNRIPPSGFDIGSVPPEVLPGGVEGDDNFNLNNAGQDTITYRLPVSETAEPPFSVESTLYYQSIRPTFVDAAHGEHPWIREFETIASINPPPAEVLASANFMVDVVE
ncbi:hypothetical protein [Marinobacter sp.]|uniref:hypothetical protein n=1 Tax=Marinobacter sp. TaxID=50741 RepID=UPI00356B207F